MIFRRALALMAMACFLPVLLHVALGVDGDALIGAAASTAPNPTLDSQNRFYGAAFGIYGALLLYCASDIERYRGVLKLVFAGIFIGGCARFISFFKFGWPSDEILFLWATEILIPPIMWIWLTRELAACRLNASAD
jgi:hypothetical protein